MKRRHAICLDFHSTPFQPQKRYQQGEKKLTLQTNVKEEVSVDGLLRHATMPTTVLFTEIINRMLGH